MSEGIQLGTEHQRVTVTVEEIQSKHLLSDRDLQLLITPEFKFATQLLWCAIGAMIGTAQGAIAAIEAVQRDSVSLATLVPITIFAAALPTSLIAGYFERRSRSGSAQFLAELQARKKLPLSFVPDLDYRLS